MPPPQFQLRAVRVNQAHASDQVELQAHYATAARDDHVAEVAVRTLSQPGVSSVRWSIANEQTTHCSGLDGLDAMPFNTRSAHTGVAAIAKRMKADGHVGRTLPIN
jgi:hypothetical protein